MTTIHQLMRSFGYGGGKAPAKAAAAAERPAKPHMARVPVQGVPRSAGAPARPVTAAERAADSRAFNAALKVAKYYAAGERALAAKQTDPADTLADAIGRAAAEARGETYTPPDRSWLPSQAVHAPTAAEMIAVYKRHQEGGR